MNTKDFWPRFLAILIISSVIGIFDVVEGYSSDYNSIKYNELERQIEQNKAEISRMRSHMPPRWNDARWETSPHFLRTYD